ncbi:CDP-glycerol glycerophosphotransferase family protein [Lysinibacillus sp. FSL M8-0134]|uniref:CDP-glycerol glycerophosphotransferase family protein n=1 Tax=Lysinibacillus sp. FSL M8-0134 TaxID=2921717 RepID=UPI003119AFF3
METEQAIFRLLFDLYRHLPIRENRVTFIHLHNNKLDENNYAIQQWIERNKLNLEICHITLEEIKEEGFASEKKMNNKARISYLLSTSQYVFLNDFYSLFSFIKIRPEIKIYQLWHGGGAFKKFGLNVSHRQSDSSTLERVKRAHSQYEGVFVSSNEVVPIYASAFGIPSKKVHPFGLVRTDFLLEAKNKEKIISKYRFLLPIKNKKVVLFALTYRENDRYREGIGINFNEVLENIPEEFVLFIKRHPFERGEFIIEEKQHNRVINVSEYPINELLVVADTLITDFSSVIFDFSLLEKPMIFFAPDYPEYEAMRGFYYPYEYFVPGPIVQNLPSLTKQIVNPEFSLEKIKEFNKKFHYKLDGKSTDRVAEFIFKDFLERG